MEEPFFFPDEVTREIRSAAQAADTTSRIAHVELAILHLEASQSAPNDSGRARHLVETAVFTRIAFSRDQE